MAAKKKTVPVILPLTTAAKRIGMKFDQLKAAAQRGEIEISFALLKPNGHLQPVVTVAGFIAFKRARAAAYEARDSKFHQGIGAKARNGVVPPQSAELGELLAATDDR